MNNQNLNMPALKRQLEAWANHLQKHNLDDRRTFIDWLSKAFSPRQFALLLDAEVERRSLWEIYLHELFGP
jgi:hypothetical protein